MLEFLAKHAHVQAAQLHSGMRAEELGLSPLEMALAVFDIENRFDVDLTPLSSVHAATVGQLVRAVLSCVDNQQPALLDG
ncbi:MAG TPA: hypothetical protein VK570_14885 [Rubrivivax sp.]|nr:hypothetical protein [Rubrivivax sp.]